VKMTTMIHGNGFFAFNRRTGMVFRKGPLEGGVAEGFFFWIPEEVGDVRGDHPDRRFLPTVVGSGLALDPKSAANPVPIPVRGLWHGPCIVVVFRGHENVATKGPARGALAVHFRHIDTSGSTRHPGWVAVGWKTLQREVEKK